MDNEKRDRWAKEYWRLTTEDLPAVAGERGWPVSEGHAFQRIVLDTICKGVWYDKIPEPAIQFMTPAQLKKATRLAEDLLLGRRMLEPLNEQSLNWREQRKRAYFS